MANVNRTVLNIAHRGASGYLPEHTLAGKALAYGMGADFLEQDVVSSADGIPLILHDVILDHVSNIAAKFPKRARTDGHFYCTDFTLNELRTLSISERLDSKTGTQVYPERFPYQQARFSINTLEEEMQFIQGLNHATGLDVGICLEIKEPAWHREQGIELSKKILPLLGSYGYLEAGSPIFLLCSERAELEEIRKQVGAVLPILQLLGSETNLSTIKLPDIARYATGIGPSIKLIYQGRDDTRKPLLSQLVDDAHQADLMVFPYTFRADDLPEGINSFQELLSLFVEQVGVDGVITDFPDKVAEYLGSVNLRLRNGNARSADID